MGVIPIGPEQFSGFVEKYKIFDMTRQLMKRYLTNWYHDDAEAFAENMRADLPAVLERYHFYNEFVSITNNYNFDRQWRLFPAPSGLPMKKMAAAPGTQQFLTAS